MKILSLLTTLCFLVASPLNATAAPQGNKGGKQKQVRISQTLQILPTAPADLAAASGRFDYKANKGRTDLNSVVRLPLAAASIGVTDAASAAAADIHLELARAREGAEPLVVDCKLALNPGSAEDIGQWQYRVKIMKVTPKAKVKSVKGSCSALPELLSSDTLTIAVYANVSGARTDLLANPAQ